METSGTDSNHRKNSITITRTLDVASTNTSPASAGKVPGQQTVRIVATDGEPAQSLRHTRNAHASGIDLADAATNSAPNDSGQVIRRSQEKNTGSKKAASYRGRDSSSVRSKLHAFQQSRRWAKEYGSQQEQLTSPTATAPSKVEQQSSIKLANSPNIHEAERQNDLPRAMSRLSDSDSLVHRQGLCRPLSMPAFYALNRTSKDKDRPQGLPMKWVRKIAHSRSRSRLKARLAEKQRSPSDSSLTPIKQPRRRIRPKRAIADLRKELAIEDKLAVRQITERWLISIASTTDQLLESMQSHLYRRCMTQRKQRGSRKSARLFYPRSTLTETGSP